MRCTHLLWSNVGNVDRTESVPLIVYTDSVILGTITEPIETCQLLHNKMQRGKGKGELFSLMFTKVSDFSLESS